VPITEALRIGAAFPWRRLESEDHVEEGPGDATLTALWTAWDVEWLAALRLPTGDDDLDAFRGARGKVVPLGNGTFDLLLGATYRMSPFFDTVIFSIPLTDADEEPPPGVELGTASASTVFNRLGVGYSIAWLALDLQWKDSARLDDGGTIAWITPGLSWGPLELAIQIPLQDGHPTVTLSVGVAW
jgi:hypothetical protein